MKATSRISTHKIYPAEMVPQEILDRLVLPNPEYWTNYRLGFSTRNIKPTIEMWFEKDGEIYIPRSVQTGIPCEQDLRTKGQPVELEFKKELRDYQYEPVKVLSETDGGILQAGTGRGKTIMALAAIAKVKTTTLILVHKEFLLNQWVERIKEFLGEDAGIIQGGTWDWEGKKIVVGMLQTIYARRDDLPEGFTDYFGLTVSDECLTYDSVVKTDIGDLPIGKIVEEKIKCNVLSYNETSKEFEYKPITNWFNQGEKEVLKLTFDNGKTLECTYDHPILTRNRGWVPAGELTEEDDIVEG